MVKITDISKTENVAKCRYYPEHDAEYGEISIDLTTRETLRHAPPDKSWSGMYVAHAKRKLLSVMDKGGDYPKEAREVWF